MKLNYMFSGFCAFVVAASPLTAFDRAALIEVIPEETIESLSQRLDKDVGVDLEEQLVFLVKDLSEDNRGQYYLVTADDDLYQRESSLSPYRAYENTLTPQERATISDIVLTLANTSYPKLLLKKGELDRKGAQIDHVHPLRHLACIFTDEQLKAGIRNIREKKLVWRSYVNGLGSSLTEESQRDNLKEGYILDFAQMVGINPSLIWPLINERRWRDFIEVLIDSIPRKGNPRRYDM